MTSCRDRRLAKQRAAFADGLDAWWAGRIHAMESAREPIMPRHMPWHSDYLVDGPDGATSLCSLCYQTEIGPADREAFARRMFLEIMADLEALQ